MMFGMWEVGVLLIPIFTIFIIHGKWSEKYFARHGIKYVQPKLPYLGNLFELLTKRVDITNHIEKIYNTFPDEKYIGFFEFTNKIIMIRDIELIKKITIKDFDHFVNHRNLFFDELDPLLGGHLFALQDQKWKDMRNTLSPAFTGSKMKMMFSLINEYMENAVTFYINKIKEETSYDFFEIESKEMYSTYAADIIASCAFGMEINSLENPQNPFSLMRKKITKFTPKQIIYLLCLIFFPSIFQLLKLQIMTDKDLEFFRELVQVNMKNREINKIIRHDMINLLMEAKKGSLKYEKNNLLDNTGFATAEETNIGQENTKTKWTDDDLTAQAFLFLVAGFDTVSNTLSFLSHELTVHQDIQKKLQIEIDQINQSINNQELSYSDLQKMKYMDMVISENLRYWCAPVTDRKCSKSYKLPPANEKTGKPYQINVNDAVYIPIRSIHHDPKYYENPEIFDPERFSDENKHKIKPYTYLPFGLGPRNCIGSRFALIEVKTILFHMLSNFHFIPSSKTQIPLKLKKGFVMEPESGFWIGLKLRRNKNMK